jgi:hypothetical protein
MRRLVERVGDWMVVAGGLALFGSLFLVWSHQFSRGFLAEWGAAAVLAGVPRNPTAWQVYSVPDVMLAVLAVSMPAVALAGGRRARLVLLAAAAGALAFTLHALNEPPTNGAAFYQPMLGTPGYVPNVPTHGPGEAVAIVGLVTAMLGLLLTLATE